MTDPRVRFTVTRRFDVTGHGTIITGDFVDESGQRLSQGSAVLRIGDRLVDEVTGAVITIRGIPFVCRPGTPPTGPAPSPSLAIREDSGTVGEGSVLVPVE
ncbi:hypothetical protein ACQBAR_15505 [Propionibacteriaceae bacterium Y1685]